ncbi:hypothetical protein ACWEKM_35630 [Streptomyces sp. NPDC004752]
MPVPQGRCDHGDRGAGLPLEDGEDGEEVYPAADGVHRTGDHALIPVRTATGGVDRPVDPAHRRLLRTPADTGTLAGTGRHRPALRAARPGQGRRRRRARAVVNETKPPPDNEADTDGNRGNRHFSGFECINLGDGEDPWSQAQNDAIGRDVAAICPYYGWNRLERALGGKDTDGIRRQGQTGQAGRCRRTAEPARENRPAQGEALSPARRSPPAVPSGVPPPCGPRPG